jgi:hypothetical protein
VGRKGVSDMRKPAYPVAVLAVASMVCVMPLCAMAQQGQNPHEQSPHQPPPKRPIQSPPVGAARPGLVQPGPQGPRNAGPPPGRGPVPQAGHFAHGPMPSHSFGGHVYHGRLAWDRGHWRHEWHNGRLGWWWDVDGVWYFYPQPMDGPPAYVSDIEAMDEVPVVDGQAPDGVEGAYSSPAPVEGGYPPPPPAPPQEAVGGAVGGAILGGLIGGAVTGRAGGAIAGALVGGTTGAVIGAEADRRHGYYWWRGNCYYRYPSGEYAIVGPRYCY